MGLVWKVPTEKPDAFALALHRLSVREYGAEELRRYLLRKGVSDAEAQAAIQRLKEEGSLNEDRYIEAVVRSQAARDKGPAYIRQKLAQKGVQISPRRLEEILREQTPREETEIIRSIVERRYPRAGSDPKILKKAWGALLRRGFSTSAIGKILPGWPKR